MTLDVSQLIGSPQVAGVKVRHIGTFRRDAALLGGAVAGVGAGNIGARIAAGRSQAVPAKTPEFKTQRAYLALTDKDLVLVSFEGSCRVRSRAGCSGHSSSAERRRVGKGWQRGCAATDNHARRRRDLAVRDSEPRFPRDRSVAEHPENCEAFRSCASKQGGCWGLTVGDTSTAIAPARP
jgi:hypothetical protein